jgi:hypothetical protein
MRQFVCIALLAATSAALGQHCSPNSGISIRFSTGFGYSTYHHPSRYYSTCPPYYGAGVVYRRYPTYSYTRPRVVCDPPAVVTFRNDCPPRQPLPPVAKIIVVNAADHDEPAPTRVTVVRQAPVRVVTTCDGVCEIECDACRARLSGGWAYLARGDARTALREFSFEVEKHPDDARAKVGYALALAFTDDFINSVWAIRRAIKLNAAALEQAPKAPDFRERVREIRDAFAQRAASDQARAADRFMVAALSHMLGEHGRAEESLTAAELAGDTDESVAILRARIESAARE